MATPTLKAPNRRGHASIIVNAKVKQEGRLIAASPVTERMVSAFKQAIATHSPDTIIETVPVASLWSEQAQQAIPLGGHIYCPLTIQLPHWLQFPGQLVFDACRDITAQRQWVNQTLHLPLCKDPNWLGDHWLPIIVTETDYQFAPLIHEGMMPNVYEQVSWSAQPYRRFQDGVEHLASSLLTELNALPAVYLLQFSLKQGILFDRLWPFPRSPGDRHH